MSELVGPHGPFTAEQTAAIVRRSRPLLVSANAGAGKTTVLAERFARTVIDDGVPAGQILAITFTDKAAAELRRRVRQRLYDLGGRDRLRALDRGWISTFHGLCARILRAHAVAAGLDPSFEVLDEAELRTIRSQALRTALKQTLSPEEDDDLDVVAAYGTDRLAALIDKTYQTLRSRGQRAPRLPALGSRPPAPERGPLRRSLTAARAALEGLAGVRVGQARAGIEATLQLLDSAAADELPALKALSAALIPTAAKVLKEGPAAECRRLQEQYIDGLEAVMEHRALSVIGRLLEFYGVAYEHGKRARSGLDFDDLELKTCDLLIGSPALRAGYRERFRAVMVDEFQDTNPVQIELLELLSEQRFAVGDVLQSIYRFRHADVAIFRSQRQHLSATGDVAALAANYRSRPELLAVIDGAFGALHGSDHVPFAAARPPALSDEPRVELLLVCGELSGPMARQAEAAMIAERIAALTGEGGVDPGGIVVLLRTLKDSGSYELALEEHGIKTLSAAAGGYWQRQQVRDLCAYLAVLCNARYEQDLFGLLASPLVGISSDGLAAIAGAARPGERSEWLTATFADPAATGAAAEPIGALPAPDRELLADFWPWFLAQRAELPSRSLEDLIARAVKARNYDLKVLALSGGERRWANVLKLQRLAADYEAAHGRDLRGFVDRVNAAMLAAERETDAPVIDSSAAAVRLMTIHAAKGLEFEVVIVADLGRRPGLTTPDLLVDDHAVGLRLRTIDGYNAKRPAWEQMRAREQDQERAEERRLMHVAMTRAEERLILCGPVDDDGKAPSGSPLRWIAPQLVPDLRQRLAQQPSDNLEQTVDVAGTPADVAGTPADVAGTPADVAGTPADVVGASLRLCVRRDLASAVDDRRQAAAVPAAAEPNARPSLPTDTGAEVTSSACAPLAAAGAISYTMLTRFEHCRYRYHLERELGLPPIEDDLLLPEGEEHRRKRGNLVHAALRRIALKAARAGQLPAVDWGRIPGGQAVGDGHLAAIELDRLVAHALAAPEFKRAAAAADDEVWREHRFMFALGGRRTPLLHGIIDLLAIEADGGALVIDYKTGPLPADEEAEALTERLYGSQRRIYALAAFMTGVHSVDVVHLYLDSPHGAQAATASYDRTDIGALKADMTARLAALCGLDRSPSERPGAELCAGCPGRAGLCSYDIDTTGRRHNVKL